MAACAAIMLVLLVLLVWLNEAVSFDLHTRRNVHSDLWRLIGGRSLSFSSRHSFHTDLSSISYVEHKTTDWVWSKIHFPSDPQEPLLATDKRRKLKWFGHVMLHDGLSKPYFRAP